MTPIRGNTFPVKSALKKLGGTWDSAAKVWMVPDEQAENARKIVAGEPLPPPPKAPLDERIAELRGLMPPYATPINDRANAAICAGDEAVIDQILTLMRSWRKSEEREDREAGIRSARREMGKYGEGRS